MPTPQDINEAFNAALNANFSQIVGVILLVGGLAFLLLIWVLNRVLKNSSKQASGDDQLMTRLITNLGAAIDNSNTAIKNNTAAMESLRETQATTLSTAKEIKADTGVIRHDGGEVQARLVEIKAQLDGMQTELSGIRTGVDSLIKDAAK